MMRNIVRRGGLFLGSALLAFVLAAPRAASSQTRSFAGPGCSVTEQETGSFIYDYYCPLTTDSTTYTVAALSGAWFDFYCSLSGQNLVFVLSKFSWSGMLKQEVVPHYCTGSSFESIFMPVHADGILYNAEEWDHLWVTVLNGRDPYATDLFGVTLCFSGGAGNCL